MAKNRYIDTKFWDDNYIIQLDPIEKLLFLYFLTNPLTNIAGIYEINIGRIAFDTGIDDEMIKKILKRFQKNKKVFYINGWVVIKNFLKHQIINPSIKSGIEREIRRIPQDILNLADIDNSKILLSLTQRQSIAIRDRFICAYCEKKIKEDDDLEIDHLIPESRGGKPNYRNLITACRKCNQKKSDKTNEEFGFPDLQPIDYHMNIAIKELKENSLLLDKFQKVFQKKVSMTQDDLYEVRVTTSNIIKSNYNSIKSNKNKTAFFKGDPMRYKKSEKKWYVIINNEWKEFVGKESDIKWK